MIMPIMIIANFIMVGVCIRYSHFWSQIKELNDEPRYAPVIGCVIVLVGFFIILLIFEAS